MKESKTQKHIDALRKTHGDRIKLKEGQEYIHSDSKLIYVCMVHPSHPEWKAVPKQVAYKSGCPKCALLTKRKRFAHTIEDLQEKIKKTHGNEIELLPGQEYINSKTKLKFRCLVDISHGTWEARPLNVTRKNNPNGCPKCAPRKIHEKKKGSLSYHAKKIKEIHGNNIALVDGQEYRNAKTKMKYQCLKSPEHEIFENTPDNIQQGQGCTTCGAKIRADKKRKTLPAHIERIKKIHGDNLKLVEGQTYKTTHSNLRYQCLLDSRHGEWVAQPSNIESRKGCPKCAEINRIVTRIGNYEHRNIEEITLYRIIIFHQDECFFKIGYTTFDVETRFRNLFKFYGYKILVIEEKKDSTRAIAEEEQNFISYTTLNHYIPEKRHNRRIMGGGRHECFELPKKYEHLYFKMMGAYHDLPIILYELPDWLK